MSTQFISVKEAAAMMGARYHTFMVWFKNDRYGLRKGSQKVGWGWVLSRKTVEAAAKEHAKN